MRREALGDLDREVAERAGKALNGGTRHAGLKLTVTNPPAVNALPAATVPASAGAGLSTRLFDRLTIAAILFVVVLVSIPRLRAFALRENEIDALRTLRVLAAQPASAAQPAGTCDLAWIVAHDASLLRRLEDVEILDGGCVRRHGYLFDITRARQGEPMLRAWPWSHGQTGRGAFVWTPQRGLLGFANPDGVFAGRNGAPEADDLDERWLSISYRR